ncbi:tissue factor pathway inhibitor a [Anguilla rostrata]|uniref:tissue factor pathway inhibitor a n=1 Tax=Anguilla rostrata TaxID=7938 RepID=UPI0030D2D4D8
MAEKLNGLFLCSGILLYISHLCSCNFDAEEGNGVQPELRIFHHSCALKMNEGTCKALKERFYFDVDTRRCQRFQYGGCNGNANNFESLEECEKMCIVKPDKNPCHLDDEPGPCRGLVPRYFFNSSSGACERFFYGGCFGNANNFRTREQCQHRCHQRKPDPVAPVIHTRRISEPAESLPEPEVVEQPGVVSVREPARPSTLPLISTDAHPPTLCLTRPDRGSCDDTIRRYVYNPHKKRCQAFRYTGCGGNQNNFASKRECVRTCMRDQAGRMRIRVKKRNFNIIFRSV